MHLLTLDCPASFSPYPYHPDIPPPAVKFDKITSRIEKMCYGLNQDYVDPVAVAQKVVQGVYPGVTTAELDELAAQTCAYQATQVSNNLSPQRYARYPFPLTPNPPKPLNPRPRSPPQHPDFEVLAARLAISNMQKTTNPVFSEVIKMLKENVHPTTGIASPLVAENIYEIVMSNKEWFDSAIDHKRDFAYGYFGYKTLERSYLFKINNKIVERPQHMIMRVAVGIHGDNLEKVKEVRIQEYFDAANTLNTSNSH